MPYRPAFNASPTHNPHDIQGYIDSQSTPASTYQFPSDRPKYYTILDFYTYSFRTGTGGTPASLLSGVSASSKASAKIVGGITAEALKRIAEGADYLGTIAQSTPLGSIILPLPLDLVDVHKVRWTEKPIFPWASLLLGAAGALGAGLGSTIVGQAIGAAGAAAAIQSIENVGGGLLGLAPNAFYTILFDRPEFKRHELSFKLAPKSYPESIAIREILRKIDNEMSPGVMGQNFSGLFKFPSIVQITIKPNDGFLFKFKPAVIETMAKNYAASDRRKAFYKDQNGVGNNPPESVQFTLQILELEYWLKGDFTSGNS